MSNLNGEHLELHTSSDGWVTIHTQPKLEPKTVGGDLLSVMSPVEWGTGGSNITLPEPPSYRDSATVTYPEIIATGFEEEYFKHGA